MEVSNSIFVPTYGYKAKSTFHQEISELANLVFFSYAFLGNYVSRKMNWKTDPLRKIALLYTLRKILLVAIGCIIYESTHFRKKELDAKAVKATSDLERKGYKLTRINLYRSGTRYSATRIIAPDVDATRWFINARGINDTMESSLEVVAERNKVDGFNTLIMNGPFVGRSTGWPTPYQLAAGIEAGMQFLEENRVTHIVVDGHSFGASMVLEAAVLHDFSFSISHNINYLFISDRTFDTFLNVAKAVVCRSVHRVVSPHIHEKFSSLLSGIVAFAAHLLLMVSGYNLDCIRGVKKLDGLGIRHLIIQVEGDRDHRIPAHTSLVAGLETAEVVNAHVRLLKSNEMTHNGNYPPAIQAERTAEILSFQKNGQS